MFVSYMKAMGWLSAVLIMTFFVLDQGLVLATSYWLSVWSDDSRSVYDTDTKYMYLGGYAGIGAAQC